ncbi:MAG: glycoside hydrolase family 127 protein [Acidobacteria bacterium]|nr:glycoside hydrolase family 127 protein [Acidobacteriota bacterium]
MGATISRRSLLLRLAASTIPVITQGKTATFFHALRQSGASPVVETRDRFSIVDPGNIKLQGPLGDRCLKNERAWLLTKNEDDLLDGFRMRPGKQAWTGEHAGKWLHAASLAYAYTRDEALRSKLDRVTSALISTQQEDGYLGTYAEGFHWEMGDDQKWDVWVHKYNLIGLLTFHEVTSNKAALDAAIKIGDLLVNVFGQLSDGTSLNLNERSTHLGMASGSVLEPMVLLHRLTGEQKYLDFSRSIVEQWESANGPRIISTLTATGSVKKTANAKAYEMLSCLVGLCELFRTTGEDRYLSPAVIAWRDITANQLLITGSGSSHEYWTDPGQFPSAFQDEVAETCVTVTWIQLNQQLLRLTGEPRYADELEKTFYNHLPAAQRPDGGAWDYFTSLEGIKEPGSDQNCCSSSGPRAWALLPGLICMGAPDGIVINFFTPGTAAIKINGEVVTIKQTTSYPDEGRVSISVTVPKPMKFSLFVRVPAWSKLNGLKAKSGEYWHLRQTWSRTQTIDLELEIPVRLVPGSGSNAGKYAVVRGPQVLAVDQLQNPGLAPLSAAAITSSSPVLKTSLTYLDAEGKTVYETDAVLLQDSEKFRTGERIAIRLSPFSTAGAYGRHFSVWLQLAQTSSK